MIEDKKKKKKKRVTNWLKVTFKNKLESTQIKSM